MIVGGDLVLITGVYLALREQMNMAYVIVLAYAATTVSDLIWYYIGKYLPRTKLSTWGFLERRKAFIDSISAFFKKNGFKTLFYSKFIYGTRTIVQVLGGAHKLKLARYLFINSLGTLGYITLIITFGYIFKSSIDDLQQFVHNAEITFAIFVAVIFFLNIWIQKILKKYLFR